MTAPEWLVPGAAVVALQPYDRGPRLRAEAVTIDRILTRDVVVKRKDGTEERFRLDMLHRRDGGTWGTTTYLVPTDDPRVEKTRSAITLSRARSNAHAMYEGWRAGRGVTAAQVADAFTNLDRTEKRIGGTGA